MQGKLSGMLKYISDGRVAGHGLKKVAMLHLSLAGGWWMIVVRGGDCGGGGKCGTGMGA